ncbi:DUF3693 domain-containing protein [Xylella fastidiosa]|uniref:DUF3693 domain-containing protein n=1 Tax=Xylella fastidiosa subsp. fastidiosa TaxID=644356 RepID=A0AAJ5UJP5_XYLFS|nr:DUF3693 domain-containing protein [Xylella fastidiosa]WCF29244.1 DUF3693 domain-containing protein [Xylella fastidiosa subsp. fastidiosa]
MIAKNNLIDKAKKMCFQNSDRALAKKLGVSAQSLHVWRQGGKIKDEYLALLIEMAHADESMFAKIREEEADTATERRIWKSMLERLTATAATALVGMGVSTPNESYASMGNKEELKQADKLVGRAGIEPATSGLKVRCTQED